MGVLDWIFGTREENEDAYAKRLEEAASRQPTMDDVPAWSRPMTSGPYDQYTGVRDELGRKQYRTITGQTYFLDWQPDQRTTRMKVEDDVLPAVQNYIENPTLPTASQVGNFAMDVAQESYDTLANTVRGQGTIGDVLGVATGVGGSGLAVSRGAADDAVGMFLNSRARGVDLDALKRAEDMEVQGVDRDQIWKDTGWGKFNGEWLTEIDDSMSEIKVQAPYKERGTETRYITVPGTLSQQDRISLRVDAQRKTLDIRQQLERGEITKEQAEWQAKQIQDALQMDLQAAPATTKVVEVNMPAPALEYKGRLNQVLFHDSLYDAIPDGVNMPTAEAARRTATSAGEPSNVRGVYYPQINSDTLLENRGRSRVSAFRPGGISKAPAQLSKSQADEVWSTALHETQHFMDDVTKSSSGLGSNPQESAEIGARAATALYEAKKAIEATPELEAVRQSLAVLLPASENISGVTISPDLAYDYLEQVHRAALNPDPDKAAESLRMFVENVNPSNSGDKIEDVLKYITSPDDNIASVIAKISQLKNSKAYRVSFMSDFDLYQHEGGEVKSRLTQHRRNLTAEQRRERPFWHDLPEVGVDERNIYSRQSPNLNVPLGSIDPALPPLENAQRTQISATLPTYRRADEILSNVAPEGRTLDFGAGLGLSQRELGYDTFEPYPRDGFDPTYRSAADIPDASYERITNFNVLNVVPREVRDAIVTDIGRILAPDGVALITTRGRDVMSANGTPGPEPMSIVTSRNTYQKGFTPAELQEYVQGILGDGYEVTRLRLGPAGVQVRRLGSPESPVGVASFGGNLFANGFSDPSDETLDVLRSRFPNMEARDEMYRVGERQNARGGVDVRIGPEKPLEEVPLYPADPERKSVFIDPELARVEYDGELYNKIIPTRGAPRLDDLIEPSDSVIYRGMSAEEYRSAIDQGFIKSKGDYNIGPEQEGLTFFSSRPSQAESYANNYTPEGYRATPDRPAYVVGIRRPKEFDYVVGETEIGLRGEIPTSRIVEVYEGRPYVFKGDVGIMDDWGTTRTYGAPDVAEVTWERKQIPSDFGYTQDNPGGTWLQRQQERAEQEIIDNAEGRFGRGTTGSIERPDVYYHGTDAAPFDVFDPAYNRTAKHIYLTPNSQDASAYGKHVLEFEARGLVADMRPGGRYRDAVVEDGRNAFQAAFEDHGLDDYFDSLEDFIDAFDAGDMYQRFGSQRVQNDVIDALLDVLNVDALRIPDAGFGGRMSESIVYQNPAYLRRVTEPSSASDSDGFAAQVSDDLLSTIDR